MIRILLLALALAMPTMALTGCGKSDKADKTEEQVKEGNKSLERMDAISQELLEKGILLQSVREVDEDFVVHKAKSAMLRMTAAELKLAKNLLNEYLVNNLTVQSALKNSEIKIKDGSKVDATDFARWERNARVLLKTIDTILL